MNMDLRRFGTVIVGGGPAGTAVILSACRSGQIGALLDRGVAIIEATGELGAGGIGTHAINSDSTGATFVDSFRHGPGGVFDELLAHPLTRELSAAAESSAPLRDAGAFMRMAGAVLHRLVASHPACAVFTHTTAANARRAGAGWQVRAEQGGRQFRINARNLVLATGATQPEQRLAQERVGGAGLLAMAGDRLVQSGEVLREGGIAQIAERLRGKTAPKIAVIGGSTSAVSVVQHLLSRLPEHLLGPGAITLLHRRALKIYFPSVEAAQAEGYTDFDERDLCPLTKRVFRLAGLRFDQKDVIMRALGIGGREPDGRLALHQLRQHDPEALRVIETADLVVAALGYRPNALPLMDARGTPLTLFAHANPQAPMVDGRCRVLDGGRRPIPGVFGIGLAAGFVPRGALGGEPSFSGQANGLWLWQTAVGGLIVDALLMPVKTARRPPAARPVPPAIRMEVESPALVAAE